VEIKVLERRRGDKILFHDIPYQIAKSTLESRKRLLHKKEDFPEFNDDAIEKSYGTPYVLNQHMIMPVLDSNRHFCLKLNEDNPDVNLAGEDNPEDPERAGNQNPPNPEGLEELSDTVVSEEEQIPAPAAERIADENPTQADDSTEHIPDPGQQNLDTDIDEEEIYFPDTDEENEEEIYFPDTDEENEEEIYFPDTDEENEDSDVPGEKRDDSP